MTIDTDKLTELLQACTPLPWVIAHNGFSVLTGDASESVQSGTNKIFWAYPDDAAAIVAVMNAAPELIARVKELEAGNDQAKMTLSMLTQKLGAL